MRFRVRGLIRHGPSICVPCVHEFCAKPVRSKNYITAAMLPSKVPAVSLLPQRSVLQRIVTNTVPCILLSELREVTRHLPLELGEVARDRRHVEASEDRFLWLAVEQEPEGRLETALRGMLARRQPFAHLSRHRDVVTSLVLSFTDDHLENERVMLGEAPDLDHVDLLGDARVLKEPKPHFLGKWRNILCWPGLPRKGTVPLGTAMPTDATGPEPLFRYFSVTLRASSRGASACSSPSVQG